MAVDFRAWGPVNTANLQGCGLNAPSIAKEVPHGNCQPPAGQFVLILHSLLALLQDPRLGIRVMHSPNPGRVDTARLISQENAEAIAGLRRLFYFGALDFKQIK